MAFASVKAPSALLCSPSSSSRCELTLLASQTFPSNLILPRYPPVLSPLSLTFARRRTRSQSPAFTSSSASSKKNKNNLSQNEAREEDIDEDAFEALFSQLEKDLKNDDISFDDGEDDEISEEDLTRLEIELAVALGEEDEVKFDNDVEEEKKDEDDDDEEEEVMPVKLKNWQLRRLASAFKTGRRKISIKSLAAELCLDRAVVLEFLREPPPSLLMLSATLPDVQKPIVKVPEIKAIDILHEETKGNSAEEARDVKVPVHVMQRSWTAQKRLKKVQVETLERVYKRTKRPTNSMISSIVQVTSMPRKRVVKWFEEKRTEDGVQDHRLPYHRSVPETILSS